MIKPCDFNSKLEEIENDYKDTYEMFDYLNKSRDGYIDENFKLRADVKKLKKLCLYLFIFFFIEFILFLICTYL